ncbi:hypothetical protein [Selenihalanaerobacter shriftii]|uniref:Capsule assembly protein Wzi n=1 Tax=Selenihalanaerobacter shriftii TaxID=142842 RepID=A0A1T4PDX6_9FIRM|nr:hypothetical protein [Selenihalanaerobacter shriftii]SJZ89750.1 hypothetical protein SAMN02745118_02142 [Selenihalanaerobacter shriftii]
MIRNKLKSISISILVIVTFLLIGSTASYAKNLPFHGFVETSIGGRYDTSSNVNNLSDDLLLSEVRAQLEYWNALSSEAEFQVTTDIVSDSIRDEADIKLREAYIWAYPSRNFEIKAGRQVLTWGTGDSLFINDLFPKDRKSYFLGRDEEYLKAPSDSIKFSIFPKGTIVDLVWTPVFESDRYIDGERLAYYNKDEDEIMLKDFSGVVNDPEKDWENGELALRVKKNYHGNEIAFYGYRGFHKQPNPSSVGGKTLEFSRLNAYGGSWRNLFLGGITNIELGYYDSVDDPDGEKTNVPNSYLKGLVGYKRDLGNDLTIGMQYFLEKMQDYDRYEKNYLNDSPNKEEYIKEENRDVVTLRIIKLLNMQTVKLDLFTYYSPADEDGYFKPKVSYDWTDNINLTLGGNIFYGDQDYTRLGQFEENSNIYFRMRYSY